MASRSLELLQPVLARILQHLPLQDRLACARLVSHAWSAAAVRATANVTKHCTSAAKAKRLLSWLRQHGQHVHSLQVSAAPSTTKAPIILQLPCPELVAAQTLELSGVKLLLDTGPPLLNPFVLKDAQKLEAQAAAEAAGVPTPPARCSCAADPLPRLQQVRLVSCRVPEGHLSSLSSAPALTSLCLHEVQLTKGHSSNTPIDRAQATAALRNMLFVCSLRGRPPLLADLGLTAVSAAADPASAALPWSEAGGALDTLDGLACLQRLTADSTVCGRLAPVLHALPPSLTHLDLCGIEVAPTKVEELAAAARLSNLQHLHLVGAEQEQIDGSILTCMFDPQLLACWRQSLTHLSLHEVGVMSFLDNTGRTRPYPAPEVVQARECERLFAAVGQLAVLQHLQLGDLCNNHSLVALQSYSALTTGSRLTALHLHSSNFDGASPPLPLGALQHVLPASRQLPRLRELVLAVDGGRHELTGEWVTDHDQPCVSGADLSRVGACCPGLTSLTLSCVLAGSDNSAAAEGLAALPATLRELRLAGAAFGDGAAAAVAAHLTQLNELCWGPSSVTPEGLAQLSALQGLSHLSLPAGCPELGVEEAVELRAAAGQLSVSQMLVQLLTSWIMQYVSRVQSVAAL